MKSIQITYTAKLKDCERDLGQGPGIIGKRIIEYKDTGNRGFKSPMFALEIIRASEELRDDVVEVTYKINASKPKKRRKK